MAAEASGPTEQSNLLLRGLWMALIDEADSILIDAFDKSDRKSLAMDDRSCKQGKAEYSNQSNETARRVSHAILLSRAVRKSAKTFLGEPLRENCY